MFNIFYKPFSNKKSCINFSLVKSVDNKPVKRLACLTDNIKNFHNTPYRYETFRDVVKIDDLDLPGKSNHWNYKTVKAQKYQGI